MTTVEKIAKLRPGVRLQPHQQRVVDRVGEGSNGLLLYHGLGTGKSLAAIAAAEGTGDPYSIVAPASLRANFNKEVGKFTQNSYPDVKSYTELALGGKFDTPPETLIVDEAHRMRNPGTASSQAIQQLAKHAKRVLLLTGSPITNEPSDLAPLLSAVTGTDVSPEEFDARFVGRRRVNPTLLQRLSGVTHGDAPELINEGELRKLVRGHVDYQAGKRPDGVKVDEEIVRVPLSADQRRIQDAIRTRIPPTTLWKLDRQFPLSEEELSRMNSFLSGLRQASLSTLPFRMDNDPTAAYGQSEKIKTAVMALRDTLRSDPRKKALVYSNFVDAGLSPYAAGLDKAKIPHGSFHGGVSEAQRQKALADYNAGRIRALLIGPAGAEGISTKGTNLIQLLDPHWHESRLQQAQGRGLRFDSHDGLPDDLKNVKVQRYISSSAEPHWLRRLLGARRQLTGDELLEAMGARKEVLNEQFRKILKEEGTMKAAGKQLPEDSIAELSDDRLRYVVQHHQQLGNREHLDLRLGTPATGLHSWAVPKAKLPEPGEKRLLVQTPVHDYSYGEFQGPLRSGRGAVRRQAYTDARVMARTPHTLRIQADGREMTLLRSPGKDGKVKWYLLGHAPAPAEKAAEDIPYEAYEAADARRRRRSRGKVLPTAAGVLGAAGLGLASGLPSRQELETAGAGFERMLHGELRPNMTTLTQYADAVSPAAGLSLFGKPISELLPAARANPKLMGVEPILDTAALRDRGGAIPWGRWLDDAAGRLGLRNALLKGINLPSYAADTANKLHGAKAHYGAFAAGPIPAVSHMMRGPRASYAIQDATLTGGNQVTYNQYFTPKFEKFVQAATDNHMLPNELTLQAMPHDKQIELLQRFHASLTPAEQTEKSRIETVEMRGLRDSNTTNYKPLVDVAPKVKGALRRFGSTAVGASALGLLSRRLHANMGGDGTDYGSRALATLGGMGLGGILANRADAGGIKGLLGNSAGERATLGAAAAAAVLPLVYKKLMLRRAAKRTKRAGDLHDWDGTLIPRLNGGAAAYMAQLEKLTPADRPKLELPAGGVDIATARPPLFHDAILKAAKRLGIKVLSIKHAPGDKVKEVGEAGGTITDDDPTIVDAVNAKYPGRGILMKAAEYTIKEKLRRLRARRGDCQECGVCLLDGCEHHKARTADEILPPVEKEAALVIEKKKRMVEETYQDCPSCGVEWHEKGGPRPKPGDEDIYVCPSCKAELEYPELSDEEIGNVTPWLRGGMLKRRDARRKRKSEKQATVPHADDLAAAEKQVEANPSPEKAKAGNYRKGHFRMHGLSITLETAKGQYRRGVDRKGKAWAVKMPVSYGYVKRTVSEADEDHIDVFVGPKTSSRNVYVIDQVNADGKFDEHKCMLGFDTQADAVATYKSAYTGIAPYGGCTPVTWEQFRWWIHNGVTSKPMAGQPLEAKRDKRMVVTKAAAAPDRRLLHMLPEEALESAKTNGLLSAAALAKHPKLLELAIPDPTDRAGLLKRVASTSLDQHRGTSLSFVAPPASVKLPANHPTVTRKMVAVRVLIDRLLKDAPKTRLYGMELQPYTDGIGKIPDKQWDVMPKAEQDRLIAQRHRDLTPAEFDELAARSPDDLWKAYKPTDKPMYSPDVPHVAVITPDGKIDPKYLEFDTPAEKAASNLPKLKVMASDGTEKVAVGLEFATTPETRAAGLSHREKLADGTGMLFDTPGPFWMKDCAIPLDLTWLSQDGKVLKTAQMPVPASPRDLRLYYPPTGAVAALETNLGWARKHSVLPGDIITLESQ